MAVAANLLPTIHRREPGALLLRLTSGMRFIVALIALLSFAACGDGDDGSPTATPGSGIEGLVLAGPACPVEQEGSPCPDTPLAGAPIEISPAAGEPITVESDADGRFRVSLPPGQYSVEGLPVEGQPLPAPGPSQDVTVAAGEFAEVTVTYDSGIR